MLNLQPRAEHTAALLGTKVHKCLEKHYLGGDWHDVLPSIADSEMRTKATGIMEGYFARYPFEKVNVLAVEREFSLQIEGNTFTRRFDLIYKARSSAYAMDHKTTSRPKERTGGVTLDNALITQELLGRAVVSRELDLPWGGTVLNVIPTNSNKYTRLFLSFSPRVLEEMPKSIARIMRYEKSLVSSPQSPWSYTQSFACYDRYGVCEYAPLCERGPDELYLYHSTEREV